MLLVMSECSVIRCCCQRVPFVEECLQKITILSEAVDVVGESLIRGWLVNAFS